MNSIIVLLRTKTKQFLWRTLHWISSDMTHELGRLYYLDKRWQHFSDKELIGSCLDCVGNPHAEHFMEARLTELYVRAKMENE